MSSDEFLKELRLQFDRILKVKDSLQIKANNTIAMSGSITALLIGFTVFILKDFQAQTIVFLYIGIVVLIIEIVVTSSTIHYAMRAYRLREYYYPISYGVFFNDDGEINSDLTDQFLNASKESLDNHFVEEYLKGLRQNEKAVQQVGKSIDKAQGTYLYSIVIIPVFVLMIVLSKYLTF